MCCWYFDAIKGRQSTFLSASKFKLKGLLNTINVKSQPKKSVLPLRALLIKSIIIPLWDNSREVWSHWQDFGYCFLVYFTYICLQRQFWQRQTSIGDKQEKISRCWSYLVENEKYWNVVLLIFPVHILETSSFHTLSSAKSQRTLGKGKLQLFLPSIF